VRDDQQIFWLVKIQPVHDSERERSGAVINPARVVAPMSVNVPIERDESAPWPLPDN